MYWTRQKGLIVKKAVFVLKKLMDTLHIKLCYLHFENIRIQKTLTNQDKLYKIMGV